MLSKRVQKLEPYVAGEQPKGNNKLIKLNTNENPYPPAKAVEQTLRTFDPDRFRKYPEPDFRKLRQAASRFYNIPQENIFAGNGSDEVLSFCFFSFFDNENGPLLFPDITYSFYPVYCSYYDIQYETVPLKNNFTIDISDYPDRKSCGIVFANPNAPTGHALSISELNELLEKYPPDRIVLIDEAYVDFGSDSALPLLEKHNNLVVVSTMSKSFSLAGLRVGFAFANETLIDALFCAKDSFNSYPVSVIDQELAIAALSDPKYHMECCSKIIGARDFLTEGLRTLGWNVCDSKTNFIFARAPFADGASCMQYLREKNILVRHFNKDRISDWLRITIGTMEEMQTLIQTAKGMAKEHGKNA